ncbi:MAG: hypothetical protein N4Q32_00525, partial [Neisseriaceae bacterium]|nr:hypothetical protein [Neisseriaceae bacterium]
IIEAARLPSSVTLRNSWIVDGVLMVIIGGVFAFVPSSISLAILGYTLIFWFIYTSIVQIWVATKIPAVEGSNSTWIKWLVIILSVIVIVLSIYGLFNYPFTQALLYVVVAFQFIFLGVIRFLYAFIAE